MRFLHPRLFRRNGVAVPAQRGGGSGATASRFRRNGVAETQDHAEDDRLHPGRDPDHDSLPRKLGDLLKFYPTARGKVDKPSSVFNPDTCSGVVAVCALKGLERSVDLTSVHFVNVRTGVVVTVSSIMSVGSVNDGAIRKAREIRVAGKNLQFDAALGDTVEVVYSENGEENSLVLTPRSSDELCLSFDWPEALTNVASGTVLTFVFKTRGGIAESETQENRFDVLLKDAE